MLHKHIGIRFVQKKKHNCSLNVYSNRINSFCFCIIFMKKRNPLGSEACRRGLLLEWDVYPGSCQALNTTIILQQGCNKK